MLSNLISYFYPKVISIDNVPVKISDITSSYQEAEHKELDTELDNELDNEKDNEEIKCNHDFIDYNYSVLSRINDELESRRLNQLNRVITKIPDLNELDIKILDLIVKWYPASPMVYGKCICCSKSVIVCRTMNKDIIYF